MRHTLLALPLLAACDRGEPFFDCCFDTSDRFDSGVASDSDVGSASFDITYAFSGAASCAEAGVSVVNVEATREDHEPITFSWPCSTEPIRMSDTPRGEWTVGLEAGAASRTWSGSETYVVGTEDATLAIALTCSGSGC